MSYGFETLNDYAYECHKIAKDHGFWEDRDIENILSSLAEMALIHSEVSEASEALRKDDKKNFAEELADICIRVFDTAAARKINLEQEIVNKMERNRNRSYKHGKKA